jgi:hypothetical protein
MGNKAKELAPIAVSRLTSPGLHFVGGVAGLALQVLPTGGRSWVLRATIGSRRRDMGLGGYPDVTLAGAREAARNARLLIRSGKDPIAEARAAASALRASLAKDVTFEQAARSYIAAHESGWRNAKHAQQWRNTLAKYAYPEIGGLMVRNVERAHVLAVLEPIWTEKTETATRLRGRIEQVLDWATARGYRDGLNPARWRGHLDKLLARPSKVADVEHHAALPFTEMGDFMQRLSGKSNENGPRTPRAVVSNRHCAIKCASPDGRDGPTIPSAARWRPIRHDALGSASPDEGGRRAPRLPLHLPRLGERAHQLPS